jgi:hypothetical protein
VIGPKTKPNLLRTDDENVDASSYFDSKAKKDRLRKHRASEAGKKKKRVHQKKPKAHEEKVALAIGGRRRRGSGSDPRAKGDVLADIVDFRLLVENKRVEGKASIGLQAEWLTKITREANEENARPALAVQFDDHVMERLSGIYGTKAESDWVAMPLSVIRWLLECLEIKNDL